MRFFWLYLFLLLGSLAQAQLSEQQFLRPEAAYAPRVHWLWKSNEVNREGINLDLEAMAATGMVGGRIDFQTLGSYRLSSTSWTELLLHALQQADRLGMAFDLDALPKAGVEGPTLQPEDAVQKLVWSETTIVGPESAVRQLSKPLTARGFYKDVAVLAFPEGATVDPSSVKDLTALLDPEGHLNWNAPKGRWVVVRFGSTLLDDGLGGKLQLDKLNPQAVHHFFDACLKPLLEQTKTYHGRSLVGLNLEKEEAEDLHWTPQLQAEFLKRAGYDLTPYLLVHTGRQLGSALDTKRFQWDARRVQSEMRAENYVVQLRVLLKNYGLSLRTDESTEVAQPLSPLQLKAFSDSLVLDHAAGRIEIDFEHVPFNATSAQADAVLLLNRCHRLFAKYTDCFTTLRRSNYVWQKGLSSRLGAYFSGEDDTAPMRTNLPLDRLTRKELLESATVKSHFLSLPDGRTYRFLALPDVRSLSLPMLRKLKEWLLDGLWISAPKPAAWAGNLPVGEQHEWQSLVDEIWNQLPTGVYRFGAGRLFIDVDLQRLLKESGWKPDFGFSSTDSTACILSTHFLVGQDKVWYVCNGRNQPERLLATFRSTGLQPEWWNPKTGEVRVVRIFRQLDDQTLIPLVLEPFESGFVLFRKKIEQTVFDAVSQDGNLLFSADPNIFPDHCPTDRTSERKVDNEILPDMLMQKEGILIRSKGLFSLVLPGALPKQQPRLQLKNNLPVYILRADSTTMSQTQADSSTWQTSFRLGPSDLLGTRLMLDLGSPTNALIDVFVNGKSAGLLWSAPYRMDVTELVTLGLNQLEIKMMMPNLVTLSVWKTLKE